MQKNIMGRKTGVIFSYLLLIAEVFSTLIFTPFLLSSLGQAEYGVYRLVGSVTAYLMLLDLGVGNAVIRYIAKYRALGKKDEERQFFAVSIIYYVIIAVIAIIAGAVLEMLLPTVFAKGLSEAEIILAKKLLSLTMINSAVILGTAGFANIIIAYEKFSFSKGASIVQTILKVLVGFAVLKMGMGSVGIVASTLALTIMFRGMYIFYVFFKLKLRPKIKGMRFSLIKEIVSYSSIILIQMVATMLTSMTDQVLLGALVGSASVIIGVYAVGTQIIQYFQSIGSSMNGVLMPGVVRLVESGATASQLQDEMVRIGRLIFMILGYIFTTFLLFGQQFINLWAGEENSQAFLVAAILMFAYMLTITQAIGGQILWAKNKHKMQAFLQILVAVLNVILTVFLIKWNPLLGATIGTFIALMVGNIVVMNIVFKRDIGINVWKYYYGLIKGTAPCFVLSAVIGLIIKFIPFGFDGWLRFVFNCCVMGAAYIIFMWLFGLNDYEKSLLYSIKNKLLKR